MEIQTILYPHSAPRSRTTNLIGLLGVPASLGFMLGADALLHILGIPPAERPLALRVAIVVVIVSPFALRAAPVRAIRDDVARRTRTDLIDAR